MNGYKNIYAHVVTKHFPLVNITNINMFHQCLNYFKELDYNLINKKKNTKKFKNHLEF